jgi:hypothetical protein
MKRRAVLSSSSTAVLGDRLDDIVPESDETNTKFSQTLQT